MKAKVKVMNSYNFKNYEIELSKEVDSHDLMAVNDLRIEAQSLVDYAIKQKKEAEKHDNEYNNLLSRRNQLQRDLQHFAEYHGKPKEKLGWIEGEPEEDGVEPELIDYSEQLHNAKNELEHIEFLIANWKPYDYHYEEYDNAEKAGCFDENQT